MAGTVTLTAVMDWQDGEPFEGILEVRLNAASKTDEALVGPAVWQETEFKNGTAAVALYPSSALEAGSYYTARIYSSRIIGGYKSRKKLFETAFSMPDQDANLHDLAVVEPMAVTDLEMVQLTASQAVAATSGASVAAAEARSSAETASSASAAAVEAKDAAVSAKDGAVAAGSDAASAKDAAVSAKDAAVEARDLAVSAKNDAVSAKNDAVSAKETAVSSAESAAASAAAVQAVAADLVPLEESDVEDIFGDGA